MAKRCTLVVALAALLAAAATFAAGADANAPVDVSGDWSTTPLVPTGFKQSGVNVKLPGIVLSTWSGDLVGTTVATATFLIHPDGSVVAAPAHESFTGTVGGLGSGTLEFIEEAHGQPDGSTVIGATVVRGTGDLASLEGRLIFVGTCAVDGSCEGTYSGRMHD